MNIPRDWESLLPVRRLRAACDGSPARCAHECLSLWTSLAYQVMQHGRPGYFHPDEIESFNATTDAGAFERACACGLLAPAEPPGWWFCKLFADANHALGDDWVPDDEKRFLIQKVRDGMENASKKAMGVINQLPDSVWLRLDSTTASFGERNRAIVLIRTVDATCKLAERKPEEFTDGLIADALRVVQGHPPAKLEAILRRLYFRQRSHKPCAAVPKDPELLLKHWDDVVQMIAPEEGWDAWERKKG